MNSYLSQTTKGNLLVVDDMPENLRLLTIGLAKQGYSVRNATNGTDALQEVLREQPDLILLDIKMPQMSGYDLCQRLKSEPATQEIPVVFISALDEVLDKIKAFSVGGVDYITKPFELREVVARIENQLALRNAKAEVRRLNSELEQRVEERTAQLAATNQALQREIAERREIEKALAREKAHLIAAQQVAHVGSWEFDVETQNSVWSEETFRIFGLDSERTVPNYESLLNQQIHPDDRLLWDTTVRGAIATGHPYAIECRIIRPDGGVRHVLAQGQPLLREDGQVGQLFGTVLDITERKHVEDRILHDTLHDALTGLPNRTLFIERVERSLQRVKRYPDYLFAVLFLDIDRFKMVNDSFGYREGDELLMAIARQLSRYIRTTDTVARLGGDEFAILLDDIRNIKEATRISERLGRKLRLPFRLENREVFLTASIGIAISSTGYERAEDLLRDADIAMYRAKERGKSRYEVFDKAMHERAIALLQMENDLRRALERRELAVFYQPIVALASGEIAGFEALLRWRHPKRGLIAPSEFIPLAEETGLIVPLGEWTLREACSQMRTWQNQFPTANGLQMSVNLSGKQVREPNLIDKIDRILEQTGLESHHLKLEITESVLIENIQAATAMLLELRSRHIELSIDDFGTGYSSLSYLHRFPIDTLKIDRSFISQADDHQEDFGGIVEAIVSLAHHLGMGAIAEGVETEKQLSHLRALECEAAQGYLFSRPLDSLSTTDLLASNPKWTPTP